MQQDPLNTVVQNADQLCLICCESTSESGSQLIKLSCQHEFCIKCLKQYIDTLKMYHLLTPAKLICLNGASCNQELSDFVINKIYPGEQGFVLNVIKKRYKQSKDPSITIFHCKGFLTKDRKNLVEKPSTMDRQIHSKLMNEKVKDILSGKIQEQNKKMCTNILSYNKFSIKDKSVQCYVCGVSYCPSCSDLLHSGKCEIKNAQNDLKKYKSSQNDKTTEEQSMTAYIDSNNMVKCLNPKCQIPIEKEEGCFWVKCRCSWEFCYPCKKVWGDCEHFSKYPYKKFVPPPEWMVKALNLY